MDILYNLFEVKLQYFTESFKEYFGAKFNRFKTAIEGNVANIRDEVSNIAKQNSTPTNRCSCHNNRLTSVEEKLKAYLNTPVPTEGIFA